MNALKRIAKYLHAATTIRNSAGSATLSLTSALTNTTDYVEVAADTLVGVAGARVRIYKPAAATDKAVEVLVGATVIATITQSGSISFGANYFSGLSPSVGTSAYHILLGARAAIMSVTSNVGPFVAHNSYWDGSDFRAIGADTGVMIGLTNAGLIIQTAASVAAGAVQSYVQRHGLPIAGRQWSNVTGSRAFDTVYQNTTGYEITLGITVSHSATSSVDIKVDTVSPPTGIVGRSSPLVLNALHQLTATVPNLGYYELDTIAAGASLVNWMELR